MLLGNGGSSDTPWLSLATLQACHYALSRRIQDLDAMGRYEGDMNRIDAAGYRQLWSSVSIRSICQAICQVHKISGNHIIFNIGKRWQASEKCSRMTFVEVDTSQQMVPVRMLCFATITYVFKFAWLMFSRSKNFWKYTLFRTWWELAKILSFVEVDMFRTTLWELIFVIERPNHVTLT